MSIADPPPPADNTRSRRWALRAGLLLVIVGALLLGYVGWEYFGTNWVSRRAQEQTLNQLADAWNRGEPTSTVRAGDSTVSATAIVNIPRFGPDWAVPLVEGLSDHALASGLAHDPRSAGPGEPGNFVLAGHRVTHGEPLRDMPDLRAGDVVAVETRDAVYTYVLDTDGDALVVPLTASWVTAPVPVNPDGGVHPATASGTALLTLVTCSELFHTDDRLVAFGHLQDVRRR